MIEINHIIENKNKKIRNNSDRKIIKLTTDILTVYQEISRV